MKDRPHSTTFRMTTATALCVTLLVLVPLRTSTAVTQPTVIDLRPESTVRTEASLCASAIRAIGDVANMNLDNKDELKKAFAILDRQRPNLKFYRSKLIVLGLSDSTFTSAVKKAIPNLQAAQALVKELTADPKAVLKLNGADALVKRIQQSAQSDVATLKRTAERLKEAAAKIKQVRLEGPSPNPTTRGEWKITNVGYHDFTRVNGNMDFTLADPQDPVTVFYIAMIVVFYVMLALYVILKIDEAKDEIAECQAVADARYTRCVTAARTQPFPLDAAAEALCYSEWLIVSAACVETAVIPIP